MTNVLSLVPYQVLPARFGGQKNIALFNKYLSSYVNLVCVSTRNTDISAAEGYEVLNILSDSPKRYINPLYFFKLRKIIRQRKITHLIVEHTYIGWLAVMLKIFTRVRLIVHSHNIEGTRWKTLGKWWWSILLFYEKMVHRMADFNFFIVQEDADYAIRNFSILPERCALITYGIETRDTPSKAEKDDARKRLYERHNIPADSHILLFNGNFGYAPNLKGLQRIISIINPALQAQKDFNYTIIICGGLIPETISSQSYPGILIAGFVDDMETYLKAADIMMNPVIEGGGIKTKIVEAIGFGCTVVSTVFGAAGMDINVCGSKLVMVNDNDWVGFTKAIIENAKKQEPVPPAYYEHYYWGNIIKKTAVAFGQN